MGELRFQPKIKPAHWEAIRDFVRDIVEQVDGRVPYPLKAVQPAITEFCLWSWQTAALPLDTDELFDRSVIAYYVQVGCGHLTAAARGNRRSLLLRISEVLTDTPPERLPPLPSSNPSTPYSRREIVSTVSWARGQSTDERRTNAHLLIAVGLGAGLSAQEIIALRRRDIRRTGSEVDICIRDGRTRTVPMLHEYVELLPNQSGPDDDYAFRPGRQQPFVNAITNFVQRGYAGGLRPSSQRMRATWIVHHLDARTPLSVLITAAGLESIDALARFERFARAVPADEAGRLLRFATPT